MTLYVQNSKESVPPPTKTVSTNKWIQQSYRTMNTQNSVVFLTMNNLPMNNMKRKFFKNYIYNGIKRIKYLGINLAKETKDVYTENYKMLLKKINTNRQLMYMDWKSCYW